MNLKDSDNVQDKTHIIHSIPGKDETWNPSFNTDVVSTFNGLLLKYDPPYLMNFARAVDFTGKSCLDGPGFHVEIWRGLDSTLNVRECLKSSLRKFYGRYGISLNIMKSPSPKCYMPLCDMTVYLDILNWSDITTNLRTYYRPRPNYRFWSYYHISEVSIEHCNGCGSPTEDAFFSRHLVLSHLGLTFVLMLRPFSPELVMFSDFEFRTSHGTSILLTIRIKSN